MPTVLILGAGINGVALARELILNGVDVDLVDRGDIAGGTTACSSHLIHGGLRYLEHGEFALVRESLVERTRLLRLAPQYVQPLRLYIPVRRRLGGLFNAVVNFWRSRKEQESAGPAGPRRTKPKPRGLWLVRLGLWLYDKYARDRTLPRHKVVAAGDDQAVPLEGDRFRWQCAYSDGLLRYPERFVLAMLTDATEEAAHRAVRLRVFTYHEATLEGKSVRIAPLAADGWMVARDLDTTTSEPKIIVNATGAWVDETLRKLNVEHRRLIGGTKGSHFVTYHEELRDRLAGRGVYAEAQDGRPVFVIPLGDATLVGTTDLQFSAPPETAVASAEELEYLRAAVNEVIGCELLQPSDIAWHYSGVRPLPYCDAATPAAISRGHWLLPLNNAPLPMYAIVGGKLTTCRSLAQSAAATILDRLKLPIANNSAERTIPGGESYPGNGDEVEAAQATLAAQFALRREQVEAIWQLHGTRTAEILAECRPDGSDSLCDTPFPVAYVRWVLEREWVTTLDDLVLRRLMLLYHRATRRTFHHLAGILAETDRLPPEQVTPAVDALMERLKQKYGYEC